MESLIGGPIFGTLPGRWQHLPDSHLVARTSNRHRTLGRLGQHQTTWKGPRREDFIRPPGAAICPGIPQKRKNNK